jgi:hypothetical protein
MLNESDLNNSNGFQVMGMVEYTALRTDTKGSMIQSVKTEFR